MLRKFIAVTCLLFTNAVFAQQFNFGPVLPGHSQQLIVVKGSQNSIHAVLDGYVKSNNGNWQHSIGPFKVIVGRKGIARLGSKVDGDGKTPSGLYSIGSIYGYFPTEQVKYLYWEIDKGQRWLLSSQAESVIESQDPAVFSVEGEIPHESVPLLGRTKGSTFNSSNVVKLNFEKSNQQAQVSKRAISKFGVVINYNLGKINRNRQAVFLYSWKNPRYGSEGSIALDKVDLYKLIMWLNVDKDPYIFIDYMQ